MFEEEVRGLKFKVQSPKFQSSSMFEEEVRSSKFKVQSHLDWER
jgi:hypothetical protein